MSVGENRSINSQRIQKAQEAFRLGTAKHAPKVTQSKGSGPSPVETGIGFIPGGSVVTKLLKGEAPGALSILPGGELIEDSGVPGEASKAGGELVVEGAEGLPIVGGAVKTAKSAVNTAQETGQALTKVAGDIGKLTEVKTWERIGKVLGGALIVLLGLWLLVRAISPSAAPSPTKALRSVARG